MKEEYLTAGLRQQVESLKHVLQELESERLESAALSWRLRAVELNLRRLREAA